MNAGLNNASEQFVAYWDDTPVAFCAVLHQPHGYVKNIKRCSRIVTLPDYQGIGIGKMMLDKIADSYTSDGYRFSISTTTPSLIFSLHKNPHWKLRTQGRAIGKSNKSKIEMAKRDAGTDSSNRITTSWEYVQ